MDVLERPEFKFNGSVHYTASPSEADEFALKIMSSNSDEVIVGLDLEWPVTYSSVQAKTALMQICPSATDCYLFQLSQFSEIPPVLKRLLVANRVKKVGIGIHNDLWKLERDFGIPALHIIRNSAVELAPLANTVLNCSQTWSLDGLVRNLLKHRLPKDDNLRKSDWSKLPLSEDQKKYASADAYASLLVFETLKKKCQDPF